MSTSNRSHSNNITDKIIVCPSCFQNNLSTNILCEKCKRVLPNTVVEVESREFNSNKMVEREKINSKRNFQALRKLFALVVVFGAVIFGGITYFSAQKAEKQQELARSEAEAKTKAVVTARNLEQFIGKHYLQIQEMAASPFLSDRQLWSAWSTERKKEYFQNNFVANSDGMDSYVVIDAKTGDTIFSGGTGTKTQNNRGLDYYDEVVKLKKTVIIPRRKSTKTGIAYMYLAAPSFDELGELAYVTRTRIRFEEFEREISTSIDDLDSITGDSAKPEFFLVDDIGRVIASEDPEDVDKHINTIFPAASFLRKNQNSSVEVEDGIDNSSSLIAYTPIVETRGLPELNWSLILKTKIAN